MKCASLVFVALVALGGCTRGAEAVESPPEAPSDPVVVTEPPAPLPEEEASRTPPSYQQPHTLEPQSIPLEASGAVTLEPMGASSIRDVSVARVRFVISGASAGTDAVVELVAPSGTPYQVRRSKVGSTNDESWPMEMQVPVAGTVIHESGLSGTWTARLAVAGRVISTQTFDLVP